MTYSGSTYSSAATTISSDLIMSEKKVFTVVLVALYRYRNFPIRIFQTLLEQIDGIKVYTIFYKNSDLANISNPSTDKEEELFLSTIIILNPDLVAFSVLSPYVNTTDRLTQIIKKNTSAKIIWGGIHPTISPETCIQYADIVCIGEGERALTELIKNMRDGISYHNIKNLWIKNGVDIIKNPMRKLISDLDSIPFPSYGNESYYFIESNSITKKDLLLSDSYLWVQTSRGCPYQCSYCVNVLLQSVYSGLGKYTRRRSVDSVISEIKMNLQIKDTKFNYVYFIDEIFGTDKIWIDEFHKRYKTEIGLPFSTEYNPKLLNKELIIKLKDAGLDTINFGIQSGSDNIRNIIFNRPGTNQELVSVATMLNDIGIKLKYDLILNNPYESEHDLKGTLKLLLNLPRPVFFHIYSLQYFPKYAFTKKAVSDRLITSEDESMENIETNWIYTPRLFPYTMKQKLQNIIFLFGIGHATTKEIEYILKNKTWISGLYCNWLTIKSIIYNRLLRWSEQNRLISYSLTVFKYISNGDFKGLAERIRLRIR